MFAYGKKQTNGKCTESIRVSLYKVFIFNALLPHTITAKQWRTARVIYGSNEVTGRARKLMVCDRVIALWLRRSSRRSGVGIGKRNIGKGRRSVKLCVLFCLASGRRVSDLCENATPRTSVSTTETPRYSLGYRTKTELCKDRSRKTRK